MKAWKHAKQKTNTTITLSNANHSLCKLQLCVHLFDNSASTTPCAKLRICMPELHSKTKRPNCIHQPPDTIFQITTAWPKACDFTCEACNARTIPNTIRTPYNIALNHHMCPPNPKLCSCNACVTVTHPYPT